MQKNRKTVGSPKIYDYLPSLWASDETHKDREELTGQRMKLLTKEIRKQLPPIGAQSESEDPTVYVKFFCPWSHWTWFAYEFDGEDIFFGYVKGDFDEYGTFSLSELESVKRFGLGIERDIHFIKKPLSQCK